MGGDTDTRHRARPLPRQPPFIPGAGSPAFERRPASSCPEALGSALFIDGTSLAGNTGFAPLREEKRSAADRGRAGEGAQPSPRAHALYGTMR